MFRLLILFALVQIPTLFIHAQNKLPPGKAEPFILGEIQEIQSAILAENRKLNIYLPDGYHADDTTHYPVIYLLDGSADEDFIHVVGLVQFANFSWINMIPKSIVVGIANVDRRRDFAHPTAIEADLKANPTSGGSQEFIDFIEQELQPYIDKEYRLNDTATLIGQSLGGLLAVEILLKKPYLFNKYIIVSPSLWWDNGSVLNTPVVTPNGDLAVFLAVGKEGKVMIKGAKRLASILRKKEKVRVHYQYFPELDHANILHLAVYKAFEILK